jgi:predicted nuclease of predicted toxin-antitoxin system
VKVKLDENLGKQAAAILIEAGLDVATVADQRLCSSSDAHLLDVCRTEGRCLVSLDLDFANPLRYPPDRFAGLAVVRLPSRVTRTDLAAALSLMASTLKGRDPAGHLWIVETERIREYTDDEPGT